MNQDTEERGVLNGRMARNLAFAGFALIAAYFLFTEHRAHLFDALPYLLLAACPLMHLLHHHGHGHHHDRPEHGSGRVPGSDRGVDEDDAPNDQAPR